MTRDAEYWAARRRDLLEQMERDEERLSERLSDAYARMARELSRDIAAYYQEYGEGNVIRYRHMLADLSDDDRAMLMERMDDFARKYPKWAHLMPVRASIYRLDRLEGVQRSIYMRMLEIGAITCDELEAHFAEYARLAANLAAEQMGFGEEFYAVDAPLVAATVGAAWAKGKSWSDSLWGDVEKLAGYLNDDFAQMVARGVSYDECAAQLCERFERVSRNDAKRLVYTEGTFLFNEAQAQVHEALFEYYSLSCADSRACPVCKGLQAEQEARPARFADRAPGVNFPPMHPWCRCSYTVAVEDWDAWIEDYVRRHP